MSYLELACRLLLVTVFATAVAGKIASRPAWRAFVDSLNRMDAVPARLLQPAAWASLAAEIAISLLLVVPGRIFGAAGFVLAIGLLGSFTVAITSAIRRGKNAPCRCFGASVTPLGWSHVFRNSGLMALAALGLTAALSGGPIEVAPAVVAAATGVVVGLLVTRLDDLLALFRTP
ncbi:MauE/DoxX family redox-associated membrane protein [Hamadaea sp. NPDC050747]|uniref:MauE/DoxX family redox-associated membrane protein n=1 Tax=Hamadaea sp. NPDC050747 TaxID=3155789 RepID=UPI0033FECEEF